MAEELKTVLRSQVRPAEKNKKINDFIRNVSAGDVDNILSALKTDPSIVSDGIQLKLAKTFKRADLVIQILQGSNVSCINQAVKLQWMYQEGSSFRNPGYLVDELFPTCSYSCRQKIITSIATLMKNEEKVDEIFKTIEKKYGFYTALPLLRACSRDQVTSVLMSRSVKLGDDQLLRLAKKFPDVAITYLRQVYKKRAMYEVPNYEATLKILVDVVPEDFMKLFADFPDFVSYRSFELGTRRSKKILRLNSQHVIDNIPGYESVLKIPQIRRELTWEQYKSLLLSRVEKSTNYFSGQWSSESLWKWMKILSKEKQIEILENAYSATFGKEMHECAEHLASNIITLLPEDHKLKVIEWKIDHKDSGDCFRVGTSDYISHVGHVEGFWTTMKPTHLSVPELKQLLYVEQDVSVRATLAKFLVLTCVVNNCTTEFSFVLDLLNKRCRNDQKNIRYQVIEALATAAKHIDLEKQHWGGIYDLLMLTQLYKEMGYNSNDIKTILQLAIAFHLNNKLPIDGWMGLFVGLLSSEHYRQWDFDMSLIKDPLDQKKFLEDFVHGISIACPFNNEEPFSDFVVDGAVTLVEQIIKWNTDNGSTHGKIPVLSNSWLSKVIVESFRSDASDSFYYRFHQHRLSIANQERFLRLLEKNEDFNIEKLLTSVASEPFLSYFYGRDPDRLLKEIDEIISESLKSSAMNMDFLKKLKSLNYVDLIDKLVGGCKAAIEKEYSDDSDNSDHAKKICNAFKILSVLASPSEFFQLASKFYPVDKKVDFTIDNPDSDYQVKTAIAEALKNISNPSLAVSTVEKFCVGDYLKLVLPSLYSCCTHTSQNESLVFLKKQLKDQPVSVKKNMIRLFFMISPSSDKDEILRGMWKTETNPSIRVEVFKQMYRLFNNQRSQSTWSLLKSAIEDLASEDVPCLDHLRQSTILDDVPDEFLSEFFKVSLDAVVRAEPKDTVISPIVARISNVIVHVLDQELLDRIVKDIVRNTQSTTYKRQFDSDFAQKYLLSSVEKLEVLAHRIKVVRDILKDLIDNHWKETNVSVTYFMENVCRAQLRTEEDSVEKRREILEGLSEEFERNALKTFRENFFLKLALLQFDEVVVEGRKNSERLVNFGKKVGPLLDVYLERYGGELIVWISEILEYFTNDNQLKDGEDTEAEGSPVLFIDGLLSHSHSRHHLIVAIRFLPYQAPKAANLLAIYEKVLEIVKSSEDLAVQVFWNKRY